MVKIPNHSVNAAPTFAEATDALFSPVSHHDLAEELGCSVALIRKARSDPKSSSFRTPPGGWEVTVRRLLEAKAAHFATLAKKLRATERDR